MADTPFDSIESAHEFVNLLNAQVDVVARGIAEDIAQAAKLRQEGAARRLEALQLVEYKLNQLKQHLTSSSRILNDLRALRRLLLKESR